MGEMVRRLTEAIERVREDRHGTEEEIVETVLFELEEPTSGMVFDAVGEIVGWADRIRGPVTYEQAAKMVRKVWRTMIEQAKQGSLADTPQGMALIMEQAMKVKFDV